MTSACAAHSFYLFDFDDNIMVLDTRILILNTETRQERAVSTGEFATIQPLLGRPGPYENYAVFDGSFRNFRDVPGGQLAPGQLQSFVADVERAVSAGGDRWQGPSWKFFTYACENQRPLSLVTARGHSRETLRAGVRLLAQRGLIPREPCYLSVFPVTNDAVRRELGDEALVLTVPALKRRAIVRTVEEAIRLHPSDADLRFGMSDDDPQNLNLIVRAMCDCKKTFPGRRFFVINTHAHEEVKLEVFPISQPVVGHPAAGADHLL